MPNSNVILHATDLIFGRWYRYHGIDTSIKIGYLTVTSEPHGHLLVCSRQTVVFVHLYSVTALAADNCKIDPHHGLRWLVLIQQ
jgi:hypothetical protein